MVWLVEHATVRATPIKPVLEPITPKKRAESSDLRGRTVRA
jgi:hypothetical protein